MEKRKERGRKFPFLFLFLRVFFHRDHAFFAAERGKSVFRFLYFRRKNTEKTCFPVCFRKKKTFFTETDKKAGKGHKLRLFGESIV